MSCFLKICYGKLQVFEFILLNLLLLRLTDSLSAYRDYLVVNHLLRMQQRYLSENVVQMVSHFREFVLSLCQMENGVGVISD